MTYCVALYLKDGLVFVSDTRTNAGVDNIATYSKMFIVNKPGERVVVAMTAGNLAVTQGVMNRVIEGVGAEEGAHTLATAPSLVEAAELVGAAVRALYARDGEALQAQEVSFDPAIIIGGQIAGRRMRLFRVYSAGNFIEATPDTPFLQIGEHKYGKPILDRALSHDTGLADGMKLALVSMDSTLRSNLTVGLPVDVAALRHDAADVAFAKRIDEDDPYFRNLRTQWSEALRQAYLRIPAPDWGV